MEGATGKHEGRGASTGADHPLAELEGKGQGHGAKANGELLSCHVSTTSIIAPVEQQGFSVPAGERGSDTLSPQPNLSPPTKPRTMSDADGCSPMKNRTGSDTDRHTLGSVVPGVLPPLNIRSDPAPDLQYSPTESLRLVDTGKDDKDKGVQPKTRTSLKTAALATLSANTLQAYRRSSAAMHIELLRVFVPDILINYLETASKPLESQAFFVKAACMCADISGFTALSEKHCKKGTAGLDTLVQIINSYYSNLVNIVYSFGGDIIKIAGDALYCVFMPDEHDLRGAVLCAALCSVQLREVAADGLTLHVGISCGELCFGILGGIDNYWECLMSGVPIGLVAGALDEAKKQEVVVSVECMSIIGDCCRGTPLPSRNVLLNSLEPPRREKRGSVRMANMIANKGLPVELEPTAGLFPGTADPVDQSDVAAAAAAAAAAARATVRAGGEAGETGAAGLEASCSKQSWNLGESTLAAARTANDGAPIIGVADTKRAGVAVDATAAWVSSNAKARERKAGSKLLGNSDHALGAAGKMRADVSPGVLPMLQGFVPGPVTDLLAAGIFMYMAEMRTVTTLFVKLDSYSPEKHKNLLSLQIHLTTIQKILAEHEGFLRQFLVDDKGCVLIACWGVPSRSYPDNGNRCLAAAVEIHASLKVKDMKTSMGITTGHALCGRMGGKIRSEYAMVGDVINLAARLMGKAKGRIVCDEVTRDLVCSNETMVALFKRLDPIMLKGKEHPIAPFVCLAQQGYDMWETHKQLRMIGRIKLQNSVNACLDLIDKGDNVTNPEPRVVVIEGAHGTGKSMVADRIKKSASQFFRRKVHMYAMVQTQSGTPYAGIKGMLRTIFGLDHLGDDALVVKQALLKIIREVYGSAEQGTTDVAIRALSAVLGVDAGGESEVEILQVVRRPDMAGRLPLHVVHSVISELATHALGNLPAVFILDNVHLMDKMSWKLLIQFLKCHLRLLLVLTATPVEEDIKKRKNLFHAKKRSQVSSPIASKAERTTDGLNFVWHGDHGETHLHMQQYIRATQLAITTKFTLSPFSKEELRQLLQHTLAPQDRAAITESLVDTVYGLSGGNPYWCVEVVRFIKENSVGIFMSRIAVQEAGGGNEDDGTASGGVVSSPEEAMMGRMSILVVCRFERLLVEEQSVVRYASVAGLEFSMDLLHAVLPRNIRPQLDLIIQALVTARFVVYSRHTYYKFRNSMVHMVLYNLTPASSRKRMHKAVAEHYTMSHGEDPLYLPVMTYHILQARVEPKQAFTFVCKTAAHALVALCYEDCMEALEKAVELASCTSEIHAVMFVHHYISTMHEMGYTTMRKSSLGADGSIEEGGGGGDNNTIIAKPATTGCTGTSPEEGSLQPLQVRVGVSREWSDRENERSNKSGRQSGSKQEGSAKGSPMAGEEHSGALREESESRISVGSTVANGARTEALGIRIARFKTLLKEPHSRLCSAGQFCPTLQDKFPSPRRQAAIDEYADSLLKHERSDSTTPRSKTAGAAVGGAFDFFEEPVEMVRPDMIVDETTSWFAEDNNDDIDDGADGDNDDAAGGIHARSPGRKQRTGSSASLGEEARGRAGSLSSCYPGRPWDARKSKTLTSIGWKLAHLLHVCLGRYIEPGGPPPECPATADGTFSISTHRLPPEAGGGAELLAQDTDDEDGVSMSRDVSFDTVPQECGHNRTIPKAAGMRNIRSKVSSSAKLLLVEHGPGKKVQQGFSFNSAASSIRTRVTWQVSKAISGLRSSRESSVDTAGSQTKMETGGSSGDHRLAGRVKLSPLFAGEKYAKECAAAGAQSRGSNCENNRETSSSGSGTAGIRFPAAGSAGGGAPLLQQRGNDGTGGHAAGPERDRSNMAWTSAVCLVS